MVDAFEDHCWQDVVPAKDMEMYRRNRRELLVGPVPAVIVIDLYEMAYLGGALPVEVVSQTYPSSCGEYAWAAIPPTLRLLTAARAAALPIFYTTVETLPDAQPSAVIATNRYKKLPDAAYFEIHEAFTPQAGDTVIRKARASAFFGTPLAAHLTQLGIQSVIMLGESTSGCLRASAVDAYSHGFHVSIAEECCYDRSLLSHQVNLFDLHHKYADVLHVDEIIAEIGVTASLPNA
jgi:nicotinamidase-related amidase